MCSFVSNDYAKIKYKKKERKKREKEEKSILSIFGFEDMIFVFENEDHRDGT